ncbi:hypothetical protein QJS10_CPB20g00625 [Acorus calamus]|uniref:Uncharacterized protein n=1 Tax=Acorus calamus TaxID=4465 RepID=A0AAV9CAT7_ACOCL|nr:hypothetical protein QJS10_CPB20g00625 [Acorus calamus]
MIFSSFRSWSSRCRRPGTGRGWRTTWMGCSPMSGRRCRRSSGLSLDCLRPQRRRQRRNVSRHCFGIIRWGVYFNPLSYSTHPFKYSKLKYLDERTQRLITVHVKIEHVHRETSNC